MLIDLDKLSSSQAYFTMTQTVLPRPIAWVLTENQSKTYNLAPFSFFNAVCSDPPLVVISIGRKDSGQPKDTLVNLRERPDFVVHIASCTQLAALNQSSAPLPYEDSEVIAGNLQTSAVEGYRLPRLTDCKIAFMCSIHSIQEIGNNRQSLVLGLVSKIFVADECTEISESGRLIIDPQTINPLSRLGASRYSSFGETLVAERPV
jgi:flavin reductase (DIM6/NTAB) family NADH-FMN oxidoreductase RutF